MTGRGAWYAVPRGAERLTGDPIDASRQRACFVSESSSRNSCGLHLVEGYENVS